MRDRRPSGFTLIELMVTVAVIGLLFSIAIPSFWRLQLRSKQAERTYMTTAIYRAIDDYWTQHGRFPQDLGGGDSMLILPDQPSATVSSAKQKWRARSSDPADHWDSLALVVEGSVYYRYRGVAYRQGTTREYYLEASGDLDGDTFLNRWRKTWTWVGDVKQQQAGSTLECGDCSLAMEDNPGTF